MIGYLSGIVKFSDSLSIILLLNSGAGYIVHTLESFAQESQVDLYIVCIQKENSTDLYGFKKLEEKKFFETLLLAKGVGPKIARLLLLQLGVSIASKAISSGDYKTLSSVPGVGKKLSEQIVLDLRNKIGNVSVCQEQENLQEIFEVMESLGLSKINIQERIEKLRKKKDITNISTQEIVKDLLKV